MTVIKAVHLPRVSVLLLWEPRDLWVGVYWKGTYMEAGNKMLDVYVCVIPMLPILLGVTVKPWRYTA